MAERSVGDAGSVEETDAAHHAGGHGLGKFDF